MASRFTFCHKGYTMVSLLGFSDQKCPPGIISPTPRGYGLHEDWTEQSDDLPFGVSQVVDFVRELIEMAEGGVNETPKDVLELQFGDVLTKTAVQTDDGSCLLVMAFLPKCRHSPFTPRQTVSLSTPARGMLEIFWHAEEGRYVGMRRIALDDLPDERSVMDAILATAEDAAAWFSSTRRDRISTK